MATTISSGTNPYKLGSPPDFGTLYSGRALEFDGVADYVTIPSQALTGVFTISMWIKPDDITSVNLLGLSSADTDYMWLDAGSDVNITSGDLALDFPNSSANVVLNTWVYVTVTRDGSNIPKCYMDGALTDTLSADAGTFTFDQIGRFYDGSTLFNGEISNVQVWDKAWSLTDVQYAYTHPERLITHNSAVTSGTTISNLKAWYPCTEGNPRSPQTTVYDGSEKGLGSELIGDPTLDDASYFSFLGAGAGETFNVQTHTAGKLVAIAAQDCTLSKSGLMTTGRTYRFSLVIDAYTDGRFRGNNHTGSWASIPSGAGTFTQYFVATGANFELLVDSYADFTATDMSLKEVQMGNHGTTTFVGLEQISHADDRTFSGTPNWSDAVGVRNRWTQDSGTYDEAATSGATEGTYFTDNYLKLAATSDSDARIAYLDGAHFEDADGASGAAMVSGRTYRLSYSIEITAYTSGILSVGMANASYVIDTDSDKTYAATKSAATDSVDFVYDGTSDHAVIVIGASASSAFTVYFDNFSIKEVGVATGWTTADAEPLIPQTALMGMSKPMVFDGVDDKVPLTADYSSVIDATGTFSIWFMTNNFNATQMIVSQVSTDTGTDLYLQAYMQTDANLQVRMLAGGPIDTTFDVVAGVLYHMVITWNGSSGYDVYINGSEYTGSSSTVATDFDSSSDIMIGSDSAGSSQFFDGIINEVSLWNSHFSLAQVQELFNDGVALSALEHSVYTGDGTKLRGYWRNDGAGTWSDRSDYSNPATPVTSPDTIILPEGTTSGKDILGFPLTHTNNGWLNLVSGVHASSGGAGTYVEVADNSVLDIESAVTVEAWVKTDTTASERFIVQKHSQEYGLQMDDGGVYRGVLRTAGGLVYYTSTDTAVVGTWYHLVMTYDGANVKMYKDAVLKTTTAETTNIVTSAHPLRIGCETAGNYAFDGSVDEVRIYNRTLSLAEITKNYKHGKSKHS